MTKPKTVGELLDARRERQVAAHKEATKNLPEMEARTEGFWLGVSTEHDTLKPIRDYYLLPNANAVVSPEGLEAAARTFAKWALLNDLLWGEMKEAAKERVRGITRKALEAAGLVVVDKVAEIAAGAFGGAAMKGGKWLQVRGGDKLYIVRGKD